MDTETIQGHLDTLAARNWAYLQDELARLRWTLMRHALWERARSARPELIEPIFYLQDAEAQPLTAALTEVTARCTRAYSAHDFPLKQLAREFGLNDFETQALLLALAVELDSSFDALLAQCQPGTRTPLPTVALALRLFCASANEWVEGHASIGASGPLVRFGLLHVESPDARLLAATFHLDQRIANYLLGVNEPPAGLLPLMAAVELPPADRLIRRELGAQLAAIIRGSLADGWDARLVVNLIGAAGAGKRTLAALACAELGLPVLAANAAALAREGLLPLFLREAVLQGAAPYLDAVELPEELRAAVERACADGARLTFIGTPTRAGWLEGWPHTVLVPFETPPLSAGERRRMWQARLGDALDGQADAFAVRFPFTPGDIEQVAEAARVQAMVRAADTGGETAVRPADVWRVARTHPQHRLSELARRIEPHDTWDDIVLPDAARQQLAELQAQVAEQSKVYEAWGFGKKLSRGRGVSALFSGPSGTGKTMAAEVLAGALGLELYRIDLSSVVSKYIGETEKNLARVFDAAERAAVILFFDEADALFGKRSEVKDAHDRYANIEINYLLQRMEDYQGLAILATNMRQALDEAFLRRLRFLIEFPFPDAALRTAIWRKSFPRETPLEGVDFDFLGSRFKIAGGNIRNIALNGAFLAASEGAPVQMRHLVLATKREFDKIGKACLESDFGPYFGLVK